MHSWERETGETQRAYEAFKIYRDLGPRRSLRRAAELVYGEGTGSVRRIEKWSRAHDWVARAQAYDDYHEMIRREAIESYERSQGTDFGYRCAKLQEEVLSGKEALLEKIKQMLTWPIERRVESKDGKTVNVYPARWSYATIVKALQMLDDSPDKVAFTNPSGQQSAYGQNPEDVRRRFMELIEAEHPDEPPF